MTAGFVIRDGAILHRIEVSQESDLILNVPAGCDFIASDLLFEAARLDLSGESPVIVEKTEAEREQERLDELARLAAME